MLIHDWIISFIYQNIIEIIKITHLLKHRQDSNILCLIIKHLYK